MLVYASSDYTVITPDYTITAHELPNNILDVTVKCGVATRSTTMHADKISIHPDYTPLLVTPADNQKYNPVFLLVTQDASGTKIYSTDLTMLGSISVVPYGAIYVAKMYECAMISDQRSENIKQIFNYAYIAARNKASGVFRASLSDTWIPLLDKYVVDIIENYYVEMCMLY